MTPGNPYGVPTGSVPRIPDRAAAINKALDDYELMRRKAEAWDELRARGVFGQPDLAKFMDDLLAQAKLA